MYSSRQTFLDCLHYNGSKVDPSSYSAVESYSHVPSSFGQREGSEMGDNERHLAANALGWE